MELLRDVLSRWMNHPKFDVELLRSIADLSSAIPVKIAHFQLNDKTMLDMAARRSLMDCAVNASMDKENLRNMEPDELFSYASRLEEKYSGDISQLKYLMDHLPVGQSLLHGSDAAVYLFQHFDHPERFQAYFDTLHEPHCLESPLSVWLMDLDENAKHYTLEEKILSSWFLHFAFLIGLPTLNRQSVLARYLQGQFLRKHQLDAQGLLSMNLALMPHQKTFQRVAEKFRFKGAIELVKSDMNDLIMLGLQIHQQALKEANKVLREIYHDHIEYEDMTPRQRNMVNFFFDEGYKLKKPNMAGLNERQQKIIELIFDNHFSSTKDLSLIFRCNRKTIQRDFNELLEMGLVRQMGNGAALRYTVSIKNKPHHTLENLQTIRLTDVPVQISLFGTDSYSNITPTRV